jgi:hypothetical protein
MYLAKTAALAAIALASTGGIALAAASAGGGPTEPGRTLPSAAASQAQLHAAAALAAHPADRATVTHTPHGTPSPNLNGLCHAWLAGAGRHGKSPAFAALLNAAGGAASANDFCTARIGAQPGSGNKADESDGARGKPSKVGHASAHPNRSSHPSGPPSPIPSHSHP